MVAKPLTVIQILPELDEGGVEGETLELGTYLAQAGHRSIIISGGGRLVPQLEEAGSEHITWPYIGEKSPRCFQYIPQLRKILLTEDVDVLHLRSRLPAWIAYLAWKSIPVAKRPALVTTFHGFYSVNAYSTIMTKGEKVIAVSRTIKEHIIDKYRVGDNRISLIHGGVDACIFDPEKVDTIRVQNLKKKWGVEHSKSPVIMLPGRLTSWKGQDVFIDALASIKNQNFTALCVGDTSENPGFVQKLKNQIKKTGLTEKVRLVGHCSDMPAAMLAADLVVSASSSQPEAFGKVAIEAMAMGKPIIATRHGGSLETVEEQKTGWLVEPANPLELATAISEALTDTEKRKQYGINGKARVTKHFTACRMCEKTVDLYQNLILERSGQKISDQLTVVQMLPELEGGGVERGTLEMGRYLTEKGHASIVVSGGGRMVEQLEQEKSRHITWKVGSKTPRSLLYILPLCKLLLREKVDVLHLRSRMPAWVGYCAWKLIPAEKRPALVTTFHGFYSVNSYSAIMTKGQRIIAVSESIKEHVKERYHEDNKLRLIYRGVDEDVFNPDNVAPDRIKLLVQKWNINQNVPIIMLPGRLTRLKGQQLFLKSLTLMKNKNFLALLIGDTEDNPGFTSELRLAIKQDNLQERVKLVGHCNDMPAALLLADIVVSATSVEPEAFGRTTVEAMAMGKPVIATAHGGSLETVQHDKSGWLVNPSDAQEMALALDEALDRPDKRKQFGIEGQRRTRSLFTLDSMCAKTLDIYKELLLDKLNSTAAGKTVQQTH